MRHDSPRKRPGPWAEKRRLTWLGSSEATAFDASSQGTRASTGGRKMTAGLRHTRPEGLQVTSLEGRRLKTSCFRCHQAQCATCCSDLK
ncbi:hypothetical protein NDU88_000698 [Pleurodeles waltl]|uniref:Uncharacterized protein n=1 Tax=Pleurodeles waltl TaxID=8319 RepID=A0AAV7LVG0_PLEWA|nr:hypothetical protein NDU88_000698 [Pleurodeles waltl]